MEELVLPEIIFDLFEFSCENEDCEAFGLVIQLEAPRGCQEITCGPCAKSITNLVLVNP